MTDSYQAIYDAARSKISGCNVGSAIDNALSLQFGGASHAISIIQEQFLITLGEYERASSVFRPELKKRGFVWTAIYGDVVGVGDSPDEAMRTFDTIWYTKLEQPKEGTPE